MSAACRWLSVLWLGLSLPMAGQGAMKCHAMPEMAKRLAPEQLPAPVAMKNIGNGHIAVTASPEAQMWFDQGLNLLHDFWDYESTKAFEQGVRVDPNCAMCYWGLAQATAFRGIDPDTEAIKGYYQRADQLAKNATPAERLYIKAGLEAIKASSGKKKSKAWDENVQPATHKDSNETKQWRKLVALQPQEIQPRIFLAESLIDGFFHGEPNPGTREAMGILQQLMQEHPDDTATLHYWIHIIEPGKHPELAEVAATKLGPLVPASGHMVHMPGHIFYLMGQYDRAQVSFAQSTLVDEAYMRDQHVTPDDDWNYIHNLMYSIANLVEAGHFDAANKLAVRTIAGHGTRPEALYVGNVRDGMARLNPELPAMVRSASWPKANTMLTASVAPDGMRNLAALRDGLVSYTQGMIQLDKKDAAAAAKSSGDLAKMVGDLKETKPADKDDPRDMWKDSVVRFLALASVELNASVEEAQGNTDGATSDFNKALSMEEKLGYSEPPLYLRPVLEAQADALYRAGKFSEARKSYEAALAKRPNSGFPLYGIARCDEAMKSPATADSYKNFLEAWRSADPSLPQIAHAQRWIAKHAAPANGL